MSKENKLVIGLFGFGVVGEGIYKVLQQTPSLNTVIKKICVKQAHKKRDVDVQLLTTNYNELLEDPDINVIVELINDADEAYKIITKALSLGKAVVSANKKLIAEHLPELLQLQRKYEVPLLYEAAVCGSIPIIRNLEEYYDNDLLHNICGIVNGSTNFILTKITDEGAGYKEALLQAQQLGFAETDPTLDVKGIDAVNKLTILLAHAFGVQARPETLLHIGIDRLHLRDATYAEEKRMKIKLVAQAKKTTNGKIAALVLPQFVTPESQLFYVSNEYNGVVLQSSLADKQFLYGKGAGRYPTASAVLSDISAVRYKYKYEYRKLSSPDLTVMAIEFYLRLYVSFDQWAQINKWDFESVEEHHSTEFRQYLIGTISAEKLKNAAWFYDEAVSIILMPDGIIEKENNTLKKIKKLSLQLAGA
jgi:homoserine dehydrogenase